MRVAIVGAGFSGLAVCWHLLHQYRSIGITLFDPNGVGGGASGIAAGMLHPYAGAHAKYNRWGEEGMVATRRLLKISETFLQEPVAAYTGALRLAVSEDQKEDYASCARRYPSVHWYTSEISRRYISELPELEGIFIEEGITVFPDRYLKGLWLACSAQGVILEKSACKNLSDLTDFDLIIVAAGASIISFAELRHLPVRIIKGQILELAWPEYIPPLPFPLNSLGYLVMHPSMRSCYAGATYERDYTSLLPDLSVAAPEILSKIEPIFPPIKSMKIIDCRAGARVSTSTHLPIYQQISEKCWVISGMGSKGLLYHGLMAENLCREIAKAY